MNVKRRKSSGKRRTTLKIPEVSLSEEKPRERAENVRTVVSETPTDRLQSRYTARQRDRILLNYRHALAGFTPEEALLLDGIILERGRKR